MYSPPMQLSQFISVAELALNMCKFGTFSEMQRLIQALPSLARIYLRRIECGRLPRLSTLDIRRCSSAFCNAMFSWLSLTESTQTLSVLKVNDVTCFPEWDDIINYGFLRRFLCHVELSLKCLHVDCLLSPDSGLSRSTTRLHSLQWLQTSLNMSRDSSEVRRLAKILSEAAFNELRVIDLAVDIGDISVDIDLRQWKDIDDLCSLPRLPALRAFEVELIWGGLLNIPDEAVIDERVGQTISRFRNQLSGIHERRVLLVTESVESREHHYWNSYTEEDVDFPELSTLKERSEEDSLSDLSEISSVLDS
ncbi:hypothetical protein WOLCODRAFT_146653 [Wolfiporia cocos MD-104 SS10]|uniref:Uncharacterized protein n=1 Tax=Wolfiporia cocos (strain MD-104) TaxID=742152 RepID=A0A2H3JFF4_WOLCO|nr:hypothetical protein WOLCODRAFT_146653 [Wolfiporia cocos MD-104 SS10]